MLIALMYHRVGSIKHSNPLEVFEEHLPFLKEHYPLLLPGEKIEKLSACLTFDDATYDFYHYLFPLLIKYQIRVLLGIPVKFILDSTTRSADERLSIHYTNAMEQYKEGPYCTWKELEEMVESGLVQIASHSYSHPNLLQSNNLELEIKTSKTILEERLKQSVTSFIYPFGRYNSAIQEEVAKHYTYSFRIGSALNKGWNDSPLSRLRGDQLSSPFYPHKSHLLFPLIKSFI